MQPSIFHKQNHGSITKQKSCTTNVFKIIQSYFYLILINHFLKINAYCAKSSDIDSINKSIKILKLTEKNKLGDNVADKNVNACQKQKEKNASWEKNFNHSTLPSTAESGSLPRNTDQTEYKMISIIKNHDLIFNKLIPKILKDFRELKTLYHKINGLIQKIKERPQSFYTALFKKIDEKVKERQNHYLTFEDFIGGIIKNGMAAMSILQKAHGRYQMMKINFSSDELKNIDEKDLRLISEIDYKGTELLGIMSDIQLKLDEDLKQASSFCMIVVKFFEMSPKDFKANKEIADALKSLN